MTFEEWLRWRDRPSIREIAINLDIDSFRKYILMYYEVMPNYSSKTLLKMLHEWRLRLYLGDNTIAKRYYIESLVWLNEYYSGYSKEKAD